MTFVQSGIGTSCGFGPGRSAACREFERRGFRCACKRPYISDLGRRKPARPSFDI